MCRSGSKMATTHLKSSASVERIVILSVLLALLVLHFFVVHTIAFLGFYYLPILLAGYFCGKRISLLLSILAVFLVVLYSLVGPGKMSPEIPRLEEQVGKLSQRSPGWKEMSNQLNREKFKLYFSLIVWGSFLVLCGIASSVLYEQKERRIKELRSAYVGILQILTKYLELADRYSAGRSMRVAALATAMARRLNFAEEAAEDIRIAALLHDLGHKEISALILGKSADLGKETGPEITTHSISGQELMRSVSSVLEGVVPIVNAYREYFVMEGKERAPEPVRTAAEIVAAARAYDDMVTGTPARKAKSPSEALEEIKASAARGFDPEVVKALEEAAQAGERKIEPGEPPPESRAPVLGPDEGV